MRSGAAVLERTMTEDVRAVLEAIAFGDDGRVTPSDRLRALEHLSRMGQQPDGSYSSELAALEGEELDRHLDALLAEQIAADVLGEGTQWPTLAHLVQTEVERRADSLARPRAFTRRGGLYVVASTYISRVSRACPAERQVSSCVRLGARL
jgi:hypothetical protein